MRITVPLSADARSLSADSGAAGLGRVVRCQWKHGSESCATSLGDSSLSCMPLSTRAIAGPSPTSISANGESSTLTTATGRRLFSESPPSSRRARSTSAPSSMVPLASVPMRSVSVTPWNRRLHRRRGDLPRQHAGGRADRRHSRDERATRRWSIGVCFVRQTRIKEMESILAVELHSPTADHSQASTSTPFLAFPHHQQ